MKTAGLAVLVLAGGCRAVFGLDDPTHRVVDAAVDVVVDVADDVAPVSAPGCFEYWRTGNVQFGPVQELTVLTTTDVEAGPHLSGDGRTLYFISDRPGSAALDVWVTTRASLADPWGTPMRDSTLSSSGSDYRVTFTENVLFAVVMSDRAGTVGGYDLWGTTRTSVGQPFPAPDQSGLSMINNAAHQYDPALSSDGLRLYWSGPDLGTFVSARPTRDAAWGTSTPVPALSMPSDRDPCAVGDDYVLVFTSDRSGSQGPDMWFAYRPTPQDAFGAAVRVPDVNTTASDADPVLSSDGCTLYFTSNRDGSYNLYYAVMDTN